MNSADGSPGGPGRRRRSWTRGQIRVFDPAQMRESIRGTAVGNFVEWYSFGVYGFIATTIAQVFFPGGGEGRADTGSLAATFGTLAAAFAVRPIGGWVFGMLGDRVGRRPVLVATISLMAAATTALGLLPGYQAIGAVAPVLLVITLMVQGFSTGGEYAGTMTYIDEHAPDRRRGGLAAFLPLSSQGGFLAAGTMVTALQATLPEDAMLSWGWRVPLLLSAPLGLVAITLRLRMKESPAYAEGATSADDARQGQPGSSLLGHWKPLLIVIGLVTSYNIASYMITGYLPTHLRAVVSVGHTAGLVMIVMALLLGMATVVPLAKLADRIGVKPLLWTGSALLVGLSVPAFWLMGSDSYPPVFLGVLLIGASQICFGATLPGSLPALFPPEVRYRAVTVGFNIAVSTFGGTTPLLAEWLVSTTHNALTPAGQLMAAGLIGVAVLVFMPEVARRRLPGSAPTVETEREARTLTGGERS